METAFTHTYKHTHGQPQLSINTKFTSVSIHKMTTAMWLSNKSNSYINMLDQSWFISVCIMQQILTYVDSLNPALWLQPVKEKSEFHVVYNKALCFFLITTLKSWMNKWIMFTKCTALRAWQKRVWEKQASVFRKLHLSNRFPAMKRLPALHYAWLSKLNYRQ